MKFRKKPVVIDAEQWFPGVFIDTLKYYGEDGPIGIKEDSSLDERQVITHAWCPTLEGGHWVTVGDWIITGIKGEKYPCKPDIFEATYEKVDQ